MNAHAPKSGSLVLGILLAALVPSGNELVAQVHASPHHWEYVNVRSGVHDNPTPVEGVVYQTLITMPAGTAWMRLFFSNVHLDGHSYLRIASLRDGGVQTLGAQQVAQWQNASAFFNGDTVMLELVAGPQTSGNSVEVGRVMAADLDARVPPPETICGTADNRVPSNNPAVGRIAPIGCTGWITNVAAGPNDRLHLSAGHCFAPGQIVEFNVPASNADCSAVHPPPSLQFAIDPNSIASNGGPGNDFWVFRCYPNPATGLTTFQAQGAAIALAAAIPANGTVVRSTGYGIDGTSVNNASGSSCSCSGTGGQRNQIQQTHTGSLVISGGGLVAYNLDTCGGDSGAVVSEDVTRLAVAIHTHGGCTASSGSNSGTPVTQTGLTAAIQQLANAGNGITPTVRWSEAFASTNHASIYHPTLNRIVTHGGTGAGLETLGTTRAYAPGLGWYAIETSTAPGGLTDCVMAQEASIAVLYGGVGPTGSFSSRTWTFDGNVWAEWIQAVTPSPRAGFRMAYDAGRQRVVLYGGWSATNMPQLDTWEWSMGTRWVLRATTNQGPGVRDHAMAYVGSAVYLFGGREPTGDSGQTWQLFGSGWVMVSSSGPSPRHGHAIASDGQGSAYLYGGAVTGTPGPSGSPLNALADTWRFNQSSWQQVNVGTPDTFGRFGHSMTWDHSRDVLVVHGGRAAGTRPSGSGNSTPQFGSLLSTTLELDPAAIGTAWSAPPNATMPPPVVDAAGAANPLTGEILTFGGSRVAKVFLPANQVDVTSDFWLLQGGAFAPVAGGGTVLPRARHAMCWDMRMSEYLIFGGVDAGGFVIGDTYHGSPALGWRRHVSSTLTPRQGAAVASTPQGVLLYGGRDSAPRDDAYLWDGAQWTRLSSTTLGAGRCFHSMAYDERRGEAVLFGGATDYNAGLPRAVFGETWVRSGSAWQLRSPRHSPPPLAFHGMTYDLARERIVLFGGVDNVGNYSGAVAWEWDGTDWTQRRPEVDETPRVGHVLAYDHDTGRVVAVFGNSGGLVVVEPRYYGTTAAALVSTSGIGCPGSLGPLTIATDGNRLPWLGSTLTVQVGNLPAGSIPFLLLGFAPTQIDLMPLGFPGCTQYVVINSSHYLGVPSGNVASFQWGLSPDPVFVGLPIVFQGIALLAGGANGIGVATSPRLDTTAGLR